MRSPDIQGMPLGRRMLVAVLAFVLLPPASAAAGVSLRVIGGTPAPASSWPSIAALVSASNPDPYQGQFCGGTVIAEDFVLTAAHCVDGSSAASVDVLVGRTRLSGTGGQRIDISQILVHPSYAASTNANDIALLRLAQPATSALAMPLVATGDAVTWAAGTTAFVAGWGNRSTTSGDFPDDLEQTTVEMISDASCASAYGAGFAASSMVCAGIPNVGGKDTCQGDSGGPLAVSDGHGGRLLVGATSWGTGCAMAQYPGVYARLAALRSFVETHVAAFPPRPIARPVLSGTATIGSALSCTTGAWSGSPTDLTVTWLATDADGEVQALAGTGTQRTITSAHEGSRLACRVVARNAAGRAGSDSVSSGVVTAIAAAPPRAPLPAPAPAPLPPPAPAAPLTTSTEPDDLAIGDLTPPTARIARRSCARRRCTVTVRARDTSGVVVRAKLRTGSRSRRVTIVQRGRDVWRITTPRLRAGRHTLVVRAHDGAGNALRRSLRATLRV